MLDYIYKNKPNGKLIIGKLIDKIQYDFNLLNTKCQNIRNDFICGIIYNNTWEGFPGGALSTGVMAALLAHIRNLMLGHQKKDTL